MALTPGAIVFRPATKTRWKDLEALFGPRGACAGCWCLYWRLPHAQFHAGKGAGNRRAFRRLVETGQEPGLLAYAGKQPIAWCALAPRSALPRLDRSRVLAPVDAAPVWSVPCFFVARPYRRRGLQARLLVAAAARARARGAAILEGYPVEPDGATADAFAWTGLASAFREAGFKEVARRSPTRPIMRLRLGPGAR